MSISMLLHSYQSERLKTKRSVASWLVLLGSFFIPPLIFLSYVFKAWGKPRQAPPAHLWGQVFLECWEAMAVFLLPIGIALATSLIAQLEFKNNTWKQLFTTPQKVSTIFFSKYLMVLTMLLKFFLFFNIAIVLVTLIISWAVYHIPFPSEDMPITVILKHNAAYFIDCLPIVAFQYLLSLRYRNFLVAVGIGFLLELLTLFAYSYKYGFIDPFSYAGIFYFQHLKHKSLVPPGINIHLFAIAYFLIFSIANYILFTRRKERG